MQQSPYLSRNVTFTFQFHLRQDGLQRCQLCLALRRHQN